MIPVASLAFAAMCLLQAPPEPAPAPAAPRQAPPDKRIMGVLPNYRMADMSQPFAPIPVRRKMYIGLKDSTDYPIFFLSGMFAGISQAQGSNPTYGGGMKGYGKRYASSFADQFAGNVLSESIYPSLLREDPRYFRMGTGSGGRRAWYAATRIFVTRTDRGTRRVNFSELLGVSTAVAISTSYSPEARSASEGVSKLATQLATDAAGFVLKEFWPDIKKRFFTKH